MKKCKECGREIDSKCNVLFRNDGALVIWFFKNREFVYIDENKDCLVLEPKIVKLIKKALKNQGKWFEKGIKK